MSIYQNLFDLIHTYVYGGVELTPFMELTNTLVSTMGCLFLVALPFMIVYFVIRFLTR